MAYNKDNYFRIKNEFSHKHRDRVEEAEQRKAFLENKYPELAKIDTALRLTGMEIYGAMFGSASGRKIKKIKEENDAYQQAQADFLKKLGLPQDYLLPKFDCDICQDRGTVGMRMCDCMKKQLIMAGYESSGMGNLIKNCAFDNFDLGAFSGIPDAEENMKMVYGVCRDYANNFTTDAEQICGGQINLIMTGATGLGKTHLSAAMTKTLIDRGYDVVYDTALNIFSAFEDERFGINRYTEEKKTPKYFECDVLIMDDLGTEITNQFTAMVLFNLINTRMNRKKAMIINTNLTLKELRDRYSDRITSRILGEFRPLQFIGKDYRSLRLKG